MPSKILIIDDEQSILNLVTVYLRPEGYEVQTATNGRFGEVMGGGLLLFAPVALSLRWG